jgi:hypothetical protein
MVSRRSGAWAGAARTGRCPSITADCWTSSARTHPIPTRRWRSVLAPIYLQLLEGLRRVTEGQRAAGFCRECGLPFLTLDARRSSFCTDRDRFRFSQRARRKRVDAERAAKDAIAFHDSATAIVERGPHAEDLE